MSFEKLSRQKFRRYFQPTRILLGVVPFKEKRRANLITLCFSMYSSYRPNVMAIAVQKPYLSNELFRSCDDFVLAIPGEEIADQTLQCGIVSGRDRDKVESFGFRLKKSKRVKTPSLEGVIANIECKKIGEIDVGDHTLFLGEVKGFYVDKDNEQRCLLSVGPDHKGYKVLARIIHEAA